MDLILKFVEDIDWQTIMFGALRILLVLLIAWIIMIAVRIVLGRFEKRLTRKTQVEGEGPTEASKRAETLVRLLRQGVRIALSIVVLLIILREVGVDIGPVRAMAGSGGRGVGFGAQKLVRDVISGFCLIMENQVRVGDVAVVNGKGGLVEDINFRTIVLRDLSGVVHVFPNGAIDTLANMTREWSAYVFDIGVAYKEDVDKVMEIMKDEGSKLREDEVFGALMIEDIEIFGVDQFADSAIVIKGRLRTKPIKQWDVGREYRRRLKIRFDQEGIEIPFPHRSIYFGEASSPVLAQLVNQDAANE